MGARTYRELKVWQLADRLRRQIIAMTSTEPARSDRTFCDSARDASSSVCRNLAEGFGRFSHRDFANFVRIALGSVGEVQDHLDEALAKQYVGEETFNEVWETAEHTKASALSLWRHLNQTGCRPNSRPRARPPRR